ncbi:MAG: glycine cleavage system protein H [Planctomycetes bacterium]|nr:glycine cleavage system protein H [Planctomycetota bacterium]
MSGDRVFMMGKFAAPIPDDRRYARNHMWALAIGGERTRFGFTAYAVRLLRDVYFLEWSIDEDTSLVEKQPIGAIESKKAESDLFAPAPGVLRTFNEELLRDPSAINTDTHGEGWLFEMTIERADEAASLMSADRYLEHLASVWEVTQRTIKGQWND